MTIMNTGGHCCVCTRVCMHVGGPWLCDEHKQRSPISTTPVAPTYEPLPASGGLIAAERDELRAEVAALRQQLDEARTERDEAEFTTADVFAKLLDVQADRDRLLEVYWVVEAWTSAPPLGLEGMADLVADLVRTVNAYRAGTPAEAGVIPIGTGLTPAPEGAGRLDPERAREVRERLDGLAEARRAASVASHSYMVGGSPAQAPDGERA